MYQKFCNLINIFNKVSSNVEILPLTMEPKLKIKIKNNGVGKLIKAETYNITKWDPTIQLNMCTKSLLV